MSQRVLVPLDGSPLSESVFPWLRLLASKSDWDIVLLRSYQLPSMLYYQTPELALPSTALFDDSLKEQIKDYLREKQAELAPLEVRGLQTIGEPAEEILREGEEADLIVMASHGRSGIGRWLMGSVATKVVRGTSTDILVINNRGEDDEAASESSPQVSRILVALDGSAVGELVLQRAADLARAQQADLILYQGIDCVQRAQVPVPEYFQWEKDEAESYLNLMKAKLEDLRVETRVSYSGPGHKILEAAEEEGCDLVVLGSHGRSGFVRWILGSVTESVLQKATLPVLVVHHGA